jgi:triosephosphate isomerase
MKKKPYIIANWKMNLDLSGVERFFSRFDMTESDLAKVNVVICPSFIFLEKTRFLIKEQPITVGGQNLSWEGRGAYTGEVSARQLVDVGCKYVIVGHSERRSLFNEDDAMVNKKIQIALQYGLRPIVCLGENYKEKEEGLTKKVVEEKVRNCLKGIDVMDMKKIIIAYEPIWAISTSSENRGLADSPEGAQVVHKLIRKLVADMFDERIASATPINYGGSVTHKNVGGFAAMDDIDGVLVGGASKEADNFKKIISVYF